MYSPRDWEAVRKPAVGWRSWRGCHTSRAWSAACSVGVSAQWWVCWNAPPANQVQASSLSVWRQEFFTTLSPLQHKTMTGRIVSTWLRIWTSPVLLSAYNIETGNYNKDIIDNNNVQNNCIELGYEQSYRNSIATSLFKREACEGRVKLKNNFHKCFFTAVEGPRLHHSELRHRLHPHGGEGDVAKGLSKEGVRGTLGGPEVRYQGPHQQELVEPAPGKVLQLFGSFSQPWIVVVSINI